LKTDEAARQVLALYPRIFFACHSRHVRDPRTAEVLSAHQASILDHLDEEDPLTLMELARHMGVTPGTMSIAIDRLEAGGFVSRQRDAEDGRRVNLRLTPAGARVKAAQTVLDPERLRSMLARLPAAERRAGVEGLAVLARAAQQEMHSRSGAGRRKATEKHMEEEP
jgi:DNA-binding MarR family transcriptional regulator